MANVCHRLDATDPHDHLAGLVADGTGDLGGPVAYLIGERLGPFTVYTSQLLTPDGSYTGLDGDNALIITYARDIDGDDWLRRPATSGRRRAFCSRSRRVKPG